MSEKPGLRARWRPRLVIPLVLFGGLVTLAAWWRTGSEAATSRIRIGYQKSGTLAILKSSGRLDQRLAPGTKIEWTEFSTGPQLVEALNVGSVDFGHTGDSQAVFAQAAGVPFVYVAASQASPAGSVILVKRDFPGRTIADLKGKRVVFAKGTSAHSLVLLALKANGLEERDITTIHLAPADARAAFERGEADAWSIWDPYFAAIEKSDAVRVLMDGTGLVAGREFYIARPAFLNDRRADANAILEELNAISDWSASHPREVAEILAPAAGLPVAVLEVVARRRGRYGALPLSPDIVAEQQALADTFLAAGLLSRSIRVADNVATQPLADNAATQPVSKARQASTPAPALPGSSVNGASGEAPLIAKESE